MTVATPLAIGLLDPSKDYVLARNLMPALVPLLVAVAVGFTLRRARRGGTVLGAAAGRLLARLLVWASLSPALQRPDWDAVAAALGEPTAPRAMVTWTLGQASLRYYLSTGSFQVHPSEGFAWCVDEIDFISDGPAPPPPAPPARPGLPRRSATSASAASTSVATRCRAQSLAPLRLRDVRDADLELPHQRRPSRRHRPGDDAVPMRCELS